MPLHEHRATPTPGEVALMFRIRSLHIVNLGPDGELAIEYAAGPGEGVLCCTSLDEVPKPVDVGLASLSTRSVYAPGPGVSILRLQVCFCKSVGFRPSVPQ
mmetsp:Transcript_31004/g.89611  ORF Transcript_31004/g.89611 Transcript_31004/m.89611 type:complete len:101 (+) Transcript_31004:243-545(+)